MTWDVYPPGADIGLHESVIKSIIQIRTNFLWNAYHMGGGVSVTNPGYHIFVVFVISMTGIPDYLAHALVASFFSTLTVLCAFLITRSLWTENSAFVAAFLMAVSGGDVAMLMWGGYPNVITLMLIPLVFYLFLQRLRFSFFSFIMAASLLASAVFLTHVFSAFMLICIAGAVIFVGTAFSGKIGCSKTYFMPLAIPVILGAALASPYLVNLAPLYLSSEGTVTGAVAAIRQALLSTRLVPVDLVALSTIPALLFFAFSRVYKGKAFTPSSVLLALWILIPTVLTQSYMVGLYLDYNRFLYFIVLPVTVFVALLIDHGARFFSRVITRLLEKVDASGKFVWEIKTHRTARRFLSMAMKRLTQKNVYVLLIFAFLVYSLVCLPIFMAPNVGIQAAKFYQVITPVKYETLQWIRESTPAGSVCVTDALYGWWLSGFAQRPTLSAVDPQYLILAREYAPATMAKNLLDTDYLIDNGLIQVRHDGGYVGRHNPIFLAKLNSTPFPYPFFHLNSSETTILFRKNGHVEETDLIQLPLENMWLANDSDHATIYLVARNNLLKVTQTTTVYKGCQFAQVNITVESEVENVQIDWLRLVLHAKGIPFINNETAAMVDMNMQVIGQIVFLNEKPAVKVYTSENPSSMELLYNVKGERLDTVTFFAGVYSYEHAADTEKQNEYLQELIRKSAEHYATEIADLPIEVFDYKTALKEWRVAYVIVRDAESFPRFMRDPAFDTLLINNEVAVFKVKN